MLNAESFLGTDSTQPATTQVFGVSGSGKTEFVKRMIQLGNTSTKLPEYYRTIVFDIKHAGYSNLGNVVYDMPSLKKNMKKERTTIIHPPDLDSSHEFLKEVIEYLFHLAQSIEEFGATLVIEESSTYIKSTVNGVPPHVQRLATQGRELGLGMILVNQRTLNSKWTDTQTRRIVFFRLPIPDLFMTERRWGIDSEYMNMRLMDRKFSIAIFDLEDLTTRYFEPLKIQPTP